jgi:toxin ParE1/3/4
VKVRFTPTGRAQLLAALEYIRRDRPTTATRFRRRATKALRRLERFPASGRAIPEFPDLPYREVIVSPCRFLYRVAGANVWVVAVRHSAQLPAESSL